MFPGVFCVTLLVSLVPFPLSNAVPPIPCVTQKGDARMTQEKDEPDDSRQIKSSIYRRRYTGGVNYSSIGILLLL